jgi:hypothetical protein
VGERAPAGQIRPTCQHRAGHVLENSGPIEHLERQVDALLRQIGIAT